MLRHDYSQLPVMTGERTVHGIVSWKSIGQNSVKSNRDRTVASFLDRSVTVLEASTPLIDAIEEVVQHDVVLVRDMRRIVVGIVTTADLSEQLLAMSKEFLFIGEIESGLRELVRSRFSLEELRDVRSPNSTREVKGVNDLAQGEVERLLDSPDNWARLRVDLDRTAFIECLRRVRDTRNAIMHFRVDHPGDIDSSALREMQRLLRYL